jgi:DNA-binding transcriptional ArsR family regulator
MVATEAPEKSRKTARRATPISDKWGAALVGGFQVIPNVLVRAQAHLGLDAVDLVVLLNMNMHWWKKGDFPFPRPTIIAKRMGISKRTVERRIEKLVKAGLLERIPLEGKDNLRRYRLDGLVKRLGDAAQLGLNQRDYFRVKEDDRNPKD